MILGKLCTSSVQASLEVYHMKLVYSFNLKDGLEKAVHQ